MSRSRPEDMTFWAVVAVWVVALFVNAGLLYLLFRLLLAGIRYLEGAL